MAKTYENLEIWKQAIELSGTIYLATKNFPREEAYGLSLQLRRAVVSISANIAEGAGRDSKKEFIRFVNIAIGSLNEVESLLWVAREIKYLNDPDLQKLRVKIDKLGGLLGGFKKYLNK